MPKHIRFHYKIKQSTEFVLKKKKPYVQKYDTSRLFEWPALRGSNL